MLVRLPTSHLSLSRRFSRPNKQQIFHNLPYTVTGIVRSLDFLSRACGIKRALVPYHHSAGYAVAVLALMTQNPARVAKHL